MGATRPSASAVRTGIRTYPGYEALSRSRLANGLWCTAAGGLPSPLRAPVSPRCALPGGVAALREWPSESVALSGVAAQPVPQEVADAL